MDDYSEYNSQIIECSLPAAAAMENTILRSCREPKTVAGYLLGGDNDD